MTTRIKLSRALTQACAVDYVSGRMDEDIPSSDQTLLRYSTAEGQRKYVHMYFAKSVACWRDLRHQLETANDGPVVSVGAGPWLCLLGWFWDHPPGPKQELTAVDLLDWSHVLGLDEHRALADHVLEDRARVRHLPGYYFPPGSRPPQAKGIGLLQDYLASAVPDGATVLLPFVLNHLVGRYQPVDSPKLVFDWLEAVRNRAKRVLIIDMQYENSTRGFWGGIKMGLNVNGTPICHEADSIEELSGAYSMEGYRWPSRRTNSYMRRYTPLFGSKRGWRFL